MNPYLAAFLRRSERRRALNDLMKFDDRLLSDIGLTRTDLALMRANRLPTPGRGHE